MVLNHQVQDATRIALDGVAHDLANRRAVELHHDHPARADDMHMRGRMIIGIDDETQPFDADDRRHDLILADLGK